MDGRNLRVMPSPAGPMSVPEEAEMRAPPLEIPNGPMGFRHDKSVRHESREHLSESKWFFLDNRALSTTRLSVLLAFVIWMAEMTWNVASPVRNYVLGRYGIANSEYALTRGLDWWDELDSKYVHFLYEHAGINTSELVHDQDPNSEKTRISRRVVNVYTNLMVLPLATRWAAGINKWHQDPLIGRYCQSGLRSKKGLQWAQLQLLFSTNQPFRHARNDGSTQVIANFLPDQPRCPISQIPEAILCLKGYNATDLMNLEWTTGRDPNDPSVYQALAGWQSVLLPDLDSCLERRKELVRAHREDIGLALNALADEMVRNYSVSPYGWAGKLNLVSVYNQLEGYVDVSGESAGKRSVTISGPINERNKNSYDGDIHAVTTIREAIWTCFFDARNCSLYECFTDTISLASAALFVGNQMNRTPSELIGARYIQDSTLVKGAMYGAMRQWDYLPVQEPPPVAEYLTPGSNMSAGIEMAYRDRVDLPLIYEAAKRFPVPEVTSPPLVDYKCFYEDGCEDVCVNNPDLDLAYYMVYVSKRSGKCYKRRMDADLVNRNAFVHRDCYGIGTGNHTLFFRMNQPNGPLYSWPDVPATFQVHNVADPNAILACIMGGRIPQANAQPFPLEFHDLMLLGTGMVQSVVFRDGSERTLLSMFTLVSLLATILYAYLVLSEAGFLYRMHCHVRKHFGARTSRQVFASILQITLSFRVWRLNYVLLVIMGFFSILSWTLGVHGTMCTWYLQDTPLLDLDPSSLDLSLVPSFKCRAGNLTGHLGNSLTLARLVASSFVIEMIVLGRRNFMGFTNYPASYLCLGVALGLVPAILTPFLVVAVNHWRLQSQVLASVHNQFVVAGLWMVMLVVWNRLAFHGRLGIYRLMAPFGLRCMTVKPGKYRHLVCHEYLYHGTKETVQRLENWIPLSILLEFLPQRDLYALNFQMHCMDKTDASSRSPELEWRHRQGPTNATDSSAMATCALTNSAQKPKKIPDWVENAREFFVYLDDNA